jgi:amino acid permease
MYGSLFGPTKPEDTCTSSHYVEASHGKALQTQISLPVMHHSVQHESNRNAASLADEEVGENDPNKDGSATFTSCVINLANTIIGAGMLGLPGAMAGTGYVFGVILMTLGALFSAHGLMLLSKAAQQAGLPSSFYSVARAAVPKYTILIDLAVALKCFGVATGYLITVGDCMVDALDHILMNEDTLEDESALVQIVLSRQFWVVGAVLAVIPVSFYRTLNELKKASALALVFVLFLAIGIVAYANGWADPCLDTPEGECVGEIEAFTSAPSAFSKVPIFVFAFACHQNIFPIVNEMQHRSQQRLNGAIAICIGLAFCLYLLVALEGYATFGSNARGDIILDYPQTGSVTVLRMCIAFMLTLHYPLQLDPCRRCVSSLIYAIRQYYNNRRSHNRVIHPHDSDLEAKEQSMIATTEKQSIDLVSTNPDDRLFYGITIGFLAISFVTAMIVDDLGVVLALVGATGSTLVSYILPGLIYLKIHPVMDASKIGAYIQLLMGCFIMPVALYFVLTGKAKE